MRGLGSRPDSKLLDELVERLRRLPGLRAVVLFGSRARGDWGPWSDYDVLVIADFREGYLDRLARVLELLADLPAPVEPHPYTPEEAEAMLRRGHPTIVDALEEGVVLYGGPELERLRSLHGELKRRGLRRTGASIVVPDAG